MLTPKQNFLETIKKGGKPDRIVSEYQPFVPVMNDPCGKFTRGNRKKGAVTRDVWGTAFNWPADQYAGMPHVTADDKVLPDVTTWRETLKIPDIVGNATDGWEDALEAKAKINTDEKMVLGFMGTGCFEQMHYLMGFEDTLMNMLLEPEAMDELAAMIGEYRFNYAKLLVDNLKPDIILSHDDWGSKTSLFMSPDDWRRYFKPYYKKIYGYMKDNGVIVMHHADSFLEPIVEDMVDLGIDVWQGALPSNDIVKIQKQLDGRMALMGGIDSWVDRADSTEEEIRAEVRRVCETYGPGGHFIPSLTYGLSGSIFPHTEPVVIDEIAKYNEDVYGIRA